MQSYLNEQDCKMLYSIVRWLTFAIAYERLKVELFTTLEKKTGLVNLSAENHFGVLNLQETMNNLSRRGQLF